MKLGMKEKFPLSSQADENDRGLVKSKLAKPRRILRDFCHNNDGNVIIFMSIGLPALLMGVAAAVSYSTEVSVRNDLQLALDSAVLAGGAELAGGKPIEVAQRVFLASVSKISQEYVSDMKTNFSVNNSTLSGTASGKFNNAFYGLIGAGQYDVAVSSAAIQQKASVCVLGLNAFDKGSFDINGNPTFNAACAVQANSTDNTGMTQEGKATVKAARFGVSGKHKTNSFSPAPVDGSNQISDPFASMPFPEYSNCGRISKALSIKDPVDLSPGTYCGGINVSGANVTLKPGIYVMVDGPFLVHGGGAVTGNNVMIGFTGADSTLRLWGNSSLTLTSPTSGPYMNMQFMVDQSSEIARRAWVSIGGSNGNPDGTPKLSYDGVAYFGKQNFWVFGNAIINGNSPNYAVVADKIWVQGSATVNITNENRRGLPVVPAVQVGSSAVRLLR